MKKKASYRFTLFLFKSTFMEWNEKLFPDRKIYFSKTNCSCNAHNSTEQRYDKNATMFKRNNAIPYLS